MPSLSPRSQEELARSLAGAVRRRGLQAPALLFLSLHRPLARVLANGLLLFQPLGRPLGLDQPMGDLVHLLETAGGLAALEAELER